MVDVPQPPNPRRKWLVGPRTVLRRILMLDDTPHSIALGAAVGMFIGLTPTVGVQPLLTLGAAAATRRWLPFNLVAALLTGMLTNPLTAVPVYWVEYLIGRGIVGGRDVDYARFTAIFEYEGFAEWRTTMKSLLIDVGAPLLVGSSIAAVVGGLLTYPAIRWLLRRMRKKVT